MLQKMSFTSKIAEALEQMKSLLKDSEESKEPTQNSIMSMFLKFMGDFVMKQIERTKNNEEFLISMNG